MAVDKEQTGAPENVQEAQKQTPSDDAAGQEEHADETNEDARIAEQSEKNQIVDDAKQQDTPEETKEHADEEQKQALSAAAEQVKEEEEAETEQQTQTQTDDLPGNDISGEKKEDKKTSGTEEKASDEPEERTEEEVEFNWEELEADEQEYTEEERKNLEEDYVKTLTSIEEHAVLEGVVVEMTKKEVVVNIKYKSEGVIPLSEFRYNPDLKVGDKVEVYVDSQEDKEGQLILSHKKARSLRAWERVNKALEDKEVITGLIKCRTKGGLIVDVFGIESFLPGSQIDTKPIRDYDEFVGKTMEFKVVKVNKEFKNVVVSHKALIEAELEKQKIEIMSKLEKGQVLEGSVKNITSYGVFVDLGGVDGLIHITDLSWGRVNHPEEIVELDQKINVVILDFDDDKKRIALGLKQLSEHPWESLNKDLKEGDKVKGKVVVLADYGAFIEIQPGVEGLVHVSEMSWSQHLRSAQDFFKVGDEVEAVVLSLDKEARKMSLSVRQLTPDPWIDIAEKYPVGSKQKGKVTNISHFGVFIELEEGIDGLIHISDLTWSKKINHPNEFTRVGEELDAVVLDIDQENRRLSLGHKQLEENPWETYETMFEVGSVHKGTVISKQEKGAIVELPHGVEAFAPGKHLQKEDNTKVEVDETLDFKVIEFSKEARRILVSHTNTYRDKQQIEKEREEKKKKAQARSTKKAIKQVSKKLEKTTLGDLGVLTDIKTELEENESADKKKKKKTSRSKQPESKEEEPKAQKESGSTKEEQ